MASPLVKGFPTALVIGVCAWVLTQTLLGFLWDKWKPAGAVLIGVGLGYVVQRAGLVDMGSGPNGWLAAEFFGGLGGGLAALLHPKIQDLPIFRSIPTFFGPQPPSGGTGG